jgi:membrane-associated phospholipid phosphatase
VIERPRPLLPRPRAARRRSRNPIVRAVGAADQRLLVLLRTRGHSPGGERVAGAIGAFGEWGLGWLAVGVLAGAASRERRHAWTAAGAVGPLAVAVNYAAKLTVGRERPLLEGHPRLARAPSKLSFPSAHATSSVAAATALGRVAPGSRPLFGVLATAVCAGRPYLGMHYPSDVLAGVLLGTAIGRLWPLPHGSAREVWAR